MNNKKVIKTNNHIKVKACLRCKVYIPIHAENSINMKQIKRFERDHSKHNTVIIDKKELTSNYSISQE